MKTYLTLFIVAFQSVVALAQDNDNRTPYLTKSLAKDAINSVVVTTSGGGIEVSGQSSEQPRVEVYIRGNNDRKLSNEEIKKRLDVNWQSLPDTHLGQTHTKLLLFCKSPWIQ